jgi:uncharacterized integral membrane protein (TIGR00698 family)
MSLGYIKSILPGVFISGLIALAAQFISQHYGPPAMLMSLLFGMALNFLSDETRCADGINFSAQTILRFGIAILGTKISFQLAIELGWPIIFLVVGGVIGTLAFGIAVSRLFGFRIRFAFLSAGSVAICGVSAAMAISAILPKDHKSEQLLSVCIVCVTLLSTFAMITYPIFTNALGFDYSISGVFLGTTIHDVAQVVGAGFSISEETGEVATMVKLVRVAMLAPVIFFASLFICSYIGKTGLTEKPPLIPSFVIMFLIFATINSFGLIPANVQTISAEISSWSLLLAISALGLKTSLKDIVHVGSSAIALLIAETAFLGIFTAIGLFWLYKR